MKTRTRELAKVGIFGSIDNPIIVTEKDLEEIAQTFPGQKTAPLKLGNHWSDDKPRLGNVIAVSYDNKTKVLSGTIEEHDTLSKAVDDGFYPDVSIGAKKRASDGKMYLHHLAYLGDEPPAIKDLHSTLTEELEEVSASDTQGVTLLPSPTEKKLYLSDTPSANPSEPETKQNINGVRADGGTTPVPPDASHAKEEESSMTEDEIKAVQTENERLKKEAAEKDKLLADSYRAKRESEKEQLRKAAEGKVTLPQLEQLMNLADSFEDGKVIELSDSSGKKRSESPVSVLAEIFASVSPKVQEGMINLSDTDGKPASPLCSRMLGHV